jgi:hypothetical protein
MREAHKHDSFLEGCQIALEGRENQLTASLEREATVERALYNACGRDAAKVEGFMVAARAELAKEKANG